MYKMTEHQMIMPDDFFLPFGGKLNKENRWVQLSHLIPWWKVEKVYAKRFEKKIKGRQAVSVRVALGALIIQERLGTTDRETVQQITENPYLQYFIGLPGFQEKAPFHHSLMTHFRKRLNKKAINQINEWIALEAQHQDEDDHHDDHDDDEPDQETMEETESNEESSESTPNQGKLLLDATCAPADIAYPTDLSLLNEAREKLEEMIDVLHAPHQGKKMKPRTYRRKARQAYLSVAKQKQVSGRKLRKAIGQQLRFIERDLKHIARLQENSSLTLLNKQQYKQLLVINELYRQQKVMYMNRSHRIEDRIVSISQPHVRPIVRGKAKANVEFGAKIAVSLVDGYAFMEKLDWNNYNEANTLQQSVEAYRKRHGCYPEAVLADKIYRNRENLRYCKERNIRLSGPKLGRPPKQEQAEQKQLAQRDASERNAIESKFGEGKRRYGLGLIQARLQQTSETVIALQFLVMNLEHKLRLLFYSFFKWLIHGSKRPVAV
ncbi:IS5 family transposase [Microaerobacter geothermalis]|uniref:IS5 family transposase n=1 Tax=Microaerobacter geothermalis TaxID=674972 RepID=UPI001F3AD90A|nr:IS5 family transposase [Microaerobacter geothermalis]MCF6094013.1 IS5 family transposase [Microaerobacter geothermalis]